MTFPQTALPVKVEILVGGVWTDVTGYVYMRDNGTIEISRGFAAESDNLDASRCAFTINNRDGRFSPRNPTGPYYGQIGRNTPIRVSVADAVDTGPAFDASSGIATTADASWTHTPAGVPKGVLVLIVQNAGITDEVLSVTYGGVALTELPGSPLIHSTGTEDGVIYAYFLGDTIPAGPQTVAVDVNATASTKVFRAYTITSDTTTTVVDDTTTLDSGGTADPTVTLTTTKKTRNFAALHSGQDNISGITPAAGHSRDGDGWDFGTQTADFIHASLLSNAGSPTIGWTATSEEAGVFGVAIRNGSDYARFYGEIPAWPTEWNTKGSDVWVPVEAAGILRRLGQGQPPLRAAPYRYAVANDAFAFWPLDDQSAAAFGAPGIGGNSFALRRLGQSAIHPGEGTMAAWLPNGVRIHSSAVGTVMDTQVGLATASNWAVDVVYAGEDVGAFFFSVYSGDGAVIWKVHLDSSSGNLTVRLRTGGETSSESTLSTLASPTALDGGMHTLRLETDQNGANADYIVYLDGVSVISATTGASIDQDGIAKIRLAGYTGAGDFNVHFANVAVWNGTGAVIPAASDYADAMAGHSGETAGARITRLCNEESIGFQLTGTAGDSSPLGPQYPDMFVDIVVEAATTDGGVLHEPREFLGLGYCTRAHLYNQSAALALTYSAGVLGSAPIPVDDDRFTRNDVTVQRRDGSSARATLESGALSVLAPPNGVGIYNDQVAVNVAGDGKFLEDQAGWRLHLGTVDEARYPQLHLNLASRGFTSSPSLALNAISLDICDRVTVAGLPAWLPPDTVSLLAQGFTEIIGNYARSRSIFVNCVPESPFKVLVWESAAGSTVNKWDTGGSSLTSGINSSATSLSVATATGHPVWTAVDAEDGFDIHIGGERMTVTDISGTSSPQTFTVTRSVNGVVKSHNSGAALRLWQTPVWAL